MPELTLHLPEHLTTLEFNEDALIYLNKDIKANADRFKSMHSWYRSILRSYSAVAKRERDRWLADRTVMTNNGPITIEKLLLWSGSNSDVLEDTNEGTEVIIPIGTIQTKMLHIALVWQNTTQTCLSVGEIRIHTNIADVCRYVLLANLLQVQIQLDIENMKLEEDELME